MQRKKLSKQKFCDSKKNLIISQGVVRIFKKYVNKKNKFEAGGILLGYVYRDYDEIMNISLPSKYDKRGLFFFNRSKSFAQLKIDKSWKSSSGTLIYLGEWHTHNEINPSPSETDRNMIEKALQETKMWVDYLYLVIIGFNDTCWAGRQTHKGLIRLKNCTGK
jgi:integrative and conjugative element protein (TIGR02256 family)